jgi:hypothetical protein
MSATTTQAAVPIGPRTALPPDENEFRSGTQRPRMTGRVVHRGNVGSAISSINGGRRCDAPYA